MDIGTDTQERWLSGISRAEASSAMMIGTMGYTEFPDFVNGTAAIVEAVAKKTDMPQNDNEDNDEFDEAEGAPDDEAYGNLSSHFEN